MKIGFFSPTLNRIGGGELVTLNMINAVNSRNHNVVVFTSGNISRSHIQDFFGKEVNFEIVHWPNIFDPYNFESIYFNCVTSFLSKYRCDILIDTFSNDLLPWSDAVYYQGGPKAALRSPKGAKGILFLPYKVLVANTAMFRSNEKTLMTCSQYMARLIEHFTGLHATVVYPPIAECFKTSSKEFQQKEDIVVSVMRISHDKRPETIPEIARMVSSKVCFYIVGSCRTKEQLVELRKLIKIIKKCRVERKVKLLLNISRNEQIDLLKRARIYLHPNNMESFGITIAEAMSGGCVPVVPNIGGPREFVPKSYRYNNMYEAANIVDNSIANWSNEKAKESINISERFNQNRFNEDFIKIMKI